MWNQVCVAHCCKIEPYNHETSVQAEMMSCSYYTTIFSNSGGVMIYFDRIEVVNYLVATAGKVNVSVF